METTTKTSFPGSLDVKGTPEDEFIGIGSSLDYGLQHVLTMYGGIIAPPIIIGNAVGATPEEIALLIASCLFIGGLATILQSWGLPFFGSKLPLVQGTSFAAVSTMLAIAAANEGAAGLPAVFGSVLAASAIGFIIAPFFAMIIRFFPPVVTGVVITSIGLSLTPVAANWIMGGNANNDDYGSLTNIGLAAFTLLVIGLLAKLGNATVSRLAVLIGIRGRFVVTAAGFILVILGVLPVLGRVAGNIPPAVLGGAGIVLFGTVTASGIRTLSKVDYRGNMNLLIVAVSITFGMLPVMKGDLYSAFPEWFQIIFHSGISSAAIMAILLNLLFNELNFGPRTVPSAAAPPRMVREDEVQALLEGDMFIGGKLVDKDGNEVPILRIEPSGELADTNAHIDPTDRVWTDEERAERYAQQQAEREAIAREILEARRSTDSASPTTEPESKPLSRSTP